MDLPLRRAATGTVLALALALLGGCGTAEGPGATPVSSPAPSVSSSAAGGAAPGTTTAPTPPPASGSVSTRPGSTLGTPLLDSPAPNGGPGAACSGWAISVAPDATGAGTPTGAVARYLHENRDWSTTPAEQWTLATPTPSGDSVTARAGATTLEIAHLADGTWLAVSGRRC
ncbi:hypothetical protein [Knoellia sp. LjRoot47]|uniref:hypothetical protein n=1 Tax=Knoellia sp. LjRoot47 TaxID=3342330 RepID=UPI003ECD5E77